MTVPLIMTDEIAYQLGKFNDFPTFYSYAVWRPNKQPFPLYRFFTWGLSWGGVPLKNNNLSETDWENVTLYGSLKTSEIKTISQKLAYIRGRLQSYSVKIDENQIWICYANSYDFRDFIVDCFNDVLNDKFLLDKIGDNGELIRNFTPKDTIPKWTIEKSETVGTIPGTPQITLKADKEVIDYILGNNSI